jgi:hypothetical protein
MATLIVIRNGTVTGQPALSGETNATAEFVETTTVDGEEVHVVDDVIPEHRRPSRSGLRRI